LIKDQCGGFGDFENLPVHDRSDSYVIPRELFNGIMSSLFKIMKVTEPGAESCEKEAALKAIADFEGYAGKLTAEERSRWFSESFFEMKRIASKALGREA
jgi:hypothetical protein